MKEKLDIIKGIFQEQYQTESSGKPEGILGIFGLVQHGGYYGGMYEGRKHMYSTHMIERLSPEKLESFIRGQLGI